MTANQLPIIALDDVSKQYQTGVDALKHVTLQIENGEFVFIVGKSGSGKSTFIKLLLKELDPTSGKLYIAGRLVNKLKRKQVPLYRRNIGVVFQDFRLLKDRTVFENIAFAVISSHPFPCHQSHTLSINNLWFQDSSYTSQP